MTNTHTSARTGPASTAQQRMLFLDQMETDRHAYTMPVHLDLTSDPNLDVLAHALADVATRHASLRSVYSNDNGRVLRHLKPTAAVEVADRRGEPYNPRTFDLGTEIPFAADLYDRSRLVLTVHHIAADGGSVPILLEDIRIAYDARARGEEPIWPASAVDYAQYAEDEGSIDVTADRPFWTSTLAPYVEPVALPLDHARSEVPSTAGRIIETVLPAFLADDIEQFCTTNCISRLIFLQIVTALALRAHGGGDLIPMGTAVDTRPPEALTDAVGLYVNTIVLPTDLTGDPTVTELTARTRSSMLDCVDRRATPFHEVVEWLRPARTPGVHPLFQVMIAEVDTRPKPVSLGPVDGVLRPPDDASSKFDLIAAIGPRGESGRLGFDILYRRELFEDRTIRTILDDMTLIAAQAVADPNRRISELATSPNDPAPRRIRIPARPRPGRRSRTLPLSERQIRRAQATLIGLHLRHDMLSTGPDTDGDTPVRTPLTATEILERSRIHSAETEFGAVANGGLRAGWTGEGALRVEMTHAAVDEESWPSVLDALTSDRSVVDVAVGSSARWARLDQELAEDLSIVDHAETWLDVVDAAVDVIDRRETASPLFSVPTAPASGGAESSAPLTTAGLPGIVETRTTVLESVREVMTELAGIESMVLWVDESDRDRNVEHGSRTVGCLRRGLPVVIDAGTLLGADADPEHAASFGVAAHLSAHTPGVFDDLPTADLQVRIHISSAEGHHLVQSDTEPAINVRFLRTDSGSWSCACSVSALADIDVAHVAKRLAKAVATRVNAVGSGVNPVVDSAFADGVDRSTDMAGLDPRERRSVESILGPLRAIYPTTSLQDGLLFHQQLDGQGEGIYLSQTVMRLSGSLDTDLLRRAADAVLAAHPQVGAGYVQLGERTVAAVPRTVRMPWATTDLRHLDADAAQVELSRFERREAAQGFDPVQPPLVRLGVALLPEGRSALVFTIEHLVLDGWSIWRFLRAVLDEYTRPGRTESSHRASYDDYVMWLRTRDRDAGLQMWRRQLAGTPGPTLLAPRRTAASVDPAGSAETVFHLDRSLTREVKELAAQTGVTTSIVYELAWALTLQKFTGQDDVVFGTVVSGRPAEIPGIDELLGLLFNTVPLRVRIDPALAVRDHLARIQDERRPLLTHPYLALSDLEECAGHRGLFDTLFVFQNIPVVPPDERLGPDGALRVIDQKLSDATHYALTVVVAPVESGARVRMMHRRDALDDARAAAIADTYRAALAALTAAPDEAAASIALLTPRELAWTRQHSGALGSAVPEHTVWDLFAARAADRPNALALVAGDVRWSFADLHSRALNLGALLRAHGVVGESRVMLFLPRTELMVEALFGVFAAGAAYVPVDTEMPVDRIEYIVRESRPHVVLTTSTLAEQLQGVTTEQSAVVIELDIEGVGNGLPAPGDVARRLDQLAYIIYTSGSTGRPKGVAVPYSGLTNMFVNHRKEIFEPVVARAGHRQLAIAHTTSFSFDASWEQLFWLLEGHTVHVIDEQTRRDPAILLDYFDAERIDAFDVTPTYGEHLVDAGLLARPRCLNTSVRDDDSAGLVFVSLGGEAVGDRLWSDLRDAPGTGGYNLYGPTEYTINALGADVQDRATPTLGRPILNTTAHVLDTALRLSAPGVIGELYLSGAGLARGYDGRPGLTAERFVANPFTDNGSRMYRTGDLVSRDLDGLISYHGRADNQVKIRGHRVETGEIQDALQRLPGIVRAAVTVFERAGGTELAAYVLVDGPEASDITASSVKDVLRELIPSYMVPASVQVVDSLPLTVNGKLDVAALPAPSESAEPVDRPRGDVESLIADAVHDVLGVTEIGRDDDFFALGGHSLAAVRLASRLRAVDLELGVRDIYARPTVAGLARAVIDGGGDGMLAPVVELRRAGDPAVFCLQPAGGLSWSYIGALRFLDPSISVYAIQDPALQSGDDAIELTSIEALVDDHVERIRAVRPHGPYHLLGWSFGGQLAHAIAARLHERREEVASLVLLDSYADVAGADTAEREDLSENGIEEAQNNFRRHMQTDPLLSSFASEVQDRLVRTLGRHLALSIPPTVGRHAGDALLIGASRGTPLEMLRRRDRQWQDRITGTVHVHSVDLEHAQLGQAHNWSVFGQRVADYIWARIE
ncbi:amino acid adenylation domain-containing protein [Rhodococcus sp. IEGM 1370]|uniref:non-ribosomal peptide synthetase n=1 Tax=Rhodococcus sp. IEGM 1370 TaxID=3082222 RepID=UPI002952CB04|nr:non-ribosomal peptide synthetase [Rhodococcus sp. IEGM 1370]MDV8077606.1 amino acid adenylation domain-containing protein [Rhodococcus sp. IEGM 1370]